MAEITNGELTSIALCWQLERADGAGLGLTSHDRPLSRDGVDHSPVPGIVPAEVTRSLGLDPTSSEVSGALTLDALSEDDLELGRWDGAAVRLLAADWADPEPEPIELLAGELGEISIENEGFTVELRGTAAALGAPVCPSTSPQCRAELGDKHCRVDLAGRSMRAIVVGSENGELTLDQAMDAKFLLGRLRYLDGANGGRSTVVIAVDGNRLRVRDLPRAAIEDGCRIELREGCDKRFATCVERFANAANFRGEPHLPGADLLTRYPGS
ncbi:MAG TPA: DUF2163 domain-containing protein [Sphingomicrobium sp.]|nr:DUF2163 domain-containing protein [Sphingomicrobium sp.]